MRGSSTNWKRRRRPGDLRVLGPTIVAAILLSVNGPAGVAAQEETSAAIVMREKVYSKLSRAQEAGEAEDYEKAFKALRDIEKIKDLAAYEKAQLYTAYGYLYFSQEKYAESIGAYEKVLLQEDLPQAFRATTLYTLAQLEFQHADYEHAAGYLEQWLAIVPKPGPEPFILLGQAYYQLGRYREAVAPVKRAVAIAQEREQPVREEWYQLLRAFYYQLEQYPQLLEVLSILVTEHPGKDYWLHLAAAYGEMGDAERQLAAYDVAYEQGYLGGGRELLVLAQLLLQADVPHRAAEVLAKGLDGGVVEGRAENYRLLSQAWILAHEDAKAIEALTTAAAVSNDGELDARLAQSYANLDDWEKTVATARSALRKGVKDAHELQVLLGMALFELERYEEAKTALRAAQKIPAGRETASRWITYIEREEERLRELRKSLE